MIIFLVSNLPAFGLESCEKKVFKDVHSSWSPTKKQMETLLKGYPNRESVFVISIDGLNLSGHARNVLKRNQVFYLGDLLLKTESELLRMEKFGKKFLSEVKDQLLQIGLRLRDDRSWFLNIEQIKELKQIYPRYKEMESVFTVPVTKLNISKFVKDKLNWHGIYYLGELVLKSENDLLNLDYFGKKSLMEVKAQLLQIGLHLKRKKNWSPNQAQISELKKSFPGEKMELIFSIFIDDLNISNRVKEKLKRQEIFYIGDLLLKTESELLSWFYFGEKSLYEVRNLLSQFGISLRK